MNFYFLFILFICLSLHILSSEEIKHHEELFSYSKDELKERENRQNQRNKKLNYIKKKAENRDEMIKNRNKSYNKKGKKMNKARNLLKTYREKKQKDINTKINKRYNKMKNKIDDELKDILKTKLNFMKEKAKKRNDHIIKLSTKEYIEYVNNTPRPYYVFMIYTALTKSNNCKMCHIAHAAYKPLAKAYFDDYSELAEQMNNNIDNNKMDRADGVQKPIFYAYVDIKTSRELWQTLQLKSAPVMVLIPPSLTNNQPNPSYFLNKIPAKYKFNVMSRTIESSDINQHIRKLTNIDVQIKESINIAF